MYYWWTGWWWFAWVIPMALLLWATLSWSSSRRYYYGGRERWTRDANWDDPLLPAIRKPHYRNRAPLNYQRSDARIAEDINDRLMLSDEIDPREVEVRVENGEVSLLGTVETRWEKRVAERIADSVAGVKDVDNRLKIGSIQHAPPPAHFEHTVPSPP